MSIRVVGEACHPVIHHERVQTCLVCVVGKQRPCPGRVINVVDVVAVGMGTVLCFLGVAVQVLDLTQEIVLAEDVFHALLVLDDRIRIIVG